MADSTAVCEPSTESARTNRTAFTELSRDELDFLYNHQRLSGGKISKMFGVASQTVYNWLREKGLVVRENTDYKYDSVKRPPKEKLYEMYHRQDMSLQDIAYVFDTIPTTVHKWFRHYGIETRNRKEARALFLASRDAVPSKDELEMLYDILGLSLADAARIEGVTKTTFDRWISSRGVTRRGHKVNPKSLLDVEEWEMMV